MSQRDSALNYVWDISLLAWVVMQQPILHTDLPLTVTVTGVATAANQTNGAQKTQVVDGSGNVAPAGDVASRAGFQKITDGTNTLPTGDAIARSIAIQMNDGTNLIGTTTHPVQVQQNGTVVVTGAVVAL